MADMRGFSIVELLIAMGIASVVGLAALSLFSTSNWSVGVQQDVVEAQQNGRVAMDRLAKDIRGAGFGLPDPPFSLSIGGQTFTSPITFTNSSTGSDAITIAGIGYNAGTLATGSNTDCNVGGTGKICLDSVASANNFFSSDLTTFKTERVYVSLNGSTFIQLASAQTERAVAKLTLGSPATLDRSYPDGTPVYIIQAVTYSIATDLTGCSAATPCLANNDLTQLRGSGRQVVAQNIEDIQFSYGIDASPRDGKIDYTAPYSEAAFYFSATGPSLLPDPSAIIAVKANITARTSNPDSKNTGFVRPSIEDRAAAATTDGYRRRVLTKVIKLRNPRQGA